MLRWTCPLIVDEKQLYQCLGGHGLIVDEKLAFINA